MGYMGFSLIDLRHGSGSTDRVNARYYTGLQHLQLEVLSWCKDHMSSPVLVRARGTTEVRFGLYTEVEGIGRAQPMQALAALQLIPMGPVFMIPAPRTPPGNSDLS